MVRNMELVLERWDDSAYTFFDDAGDDVDELIEEYGSDEGAIEAHLNSKYPDDKYFVLIDYINDRNTGIFHIRVWEK